MAGNKRARKGTSSSASNEEPKWGTEKRLSAVRSQWQPTLYKDKILKNKNPFCYERIVNTADWEKYGVFEPFKRWGWLAALRPLNCKLYSEKKKISDMYLDAVVEWIYTLKKEDGTEPPLTITLTGTVNGKVVSLSMETFSELAEGEFDTGVTIPDADYTYPNAFNLFENGPNTSEWFPMVQRLFHFEGDVKSYKLMREDLIPLARVLSMIVNFNILPRVSDQAAIRNYEVPLLHALVTGTPALSLRHIMMLNIWESRDVKDRAAVVPYVWFLSALLWEKGAIPGRVKPRHEEIKPVKTKVKGLYFHQREQVFLMSDLPKEMTYEYNGVGGPSVNIGLGDGDSSDDEAERMDVDHQRCGNGRARNQADLERDQRWGRQQFEQQVWAQEEGHFNEIRDALKAQFWMQEHYQQQNFEYCESVRHYHDYRAGRPAVPEYTPIDYTQLERSPEMMASSQFVPAPYPVLPPPMFYRPPRAGDGQGTSQSQPASPWGVAPLAKGLFESLFPVTPPDPQ